MTPIEKVRIATAILILVLFAGSVVVGLVDRSYEPPITIHVLAVALAGYLFAPVLTKKNGDDK